MFYSAISRRDHNYSGVEPSLLASNSDGASSNTISKRVFKVKDVPQDVKKEKEYTSYSSTEKSAGSQKSSISFIRNDNDTCQQTMLSTSTEKTRQALTKYCRTCAAIKMPLIDIFSKKGMEMRLSQQIKHLYEISRDSLSTQMCIDCIYDLKMSYKFFMQIKKAERKLASIHSNLSKESLTKNQEKQSCSLGSLEKVSSYGCEENSFSPEKQNRHQSFTTQQNSQNSTTPKNREESDSVSSILFTIAPLQSGPENDSKKKEEEQQMNTDIDEVASKEEDEDSIVEFDPEDQSTQEEDEEVQVSSNSSVTIYTYDTVAESYVMVENNKEKAKASLTETTSLEASSQITQIPPVNEEEKQKEETRQPNILKRRLLMPSTKKDEDAAAEDAAATQSVTAEDASSQQQDAPQECKIQKLDLSNPLNVSIIPSEDGIMYMTMKGSANSTLLMKVKKMDKPVEPKRFLIRCGGQPPSHLTSQRIDSREQIIEEQIEEYKKKREKVLGNQQATVNLTLTANATQKEVPTQKEVSMQKEVPTQKELSTQKEVPTQKEEVPTQKQVPTQEEVPTQKQVATQKELFPTQEQVPVQVRAKLENVIEISDEEKTEETEKTNEDQEKVDVENEYALRLSKLKQKWEEARRKKISLQKELNESYNEENVERLAKVLGENNTNLKEFQDYLKQRKIVLTRLKDEDIISLYEDRFSTKSTTLKPLPDLIDIQPPTDALPEENYFDCDYCPKIFPTCEKLEEHLKSHDYCILHYCEDCGEEFSTQKAKRCHSVICVRKLICQYCDIIFEGKGKKRQHEQKHIDDLYGQLCEFCGEKFKHQGTLDQHVKTRHTILEKTIQCPKCPKKFTMKQKLSFHVKSVHTTSRAYLCEDCGADFKNPASLRHHRIRKHQLVGNKRECPVCRKVVPFYGLSKHMHTHKAYSIQCPHCDKMFKNTSTLKQHVRIHEDQRQYRCDTCGVGFNRRDGLRLHMKVHEKSGSRGLKECSCQICGEKFPNHSTLVIHRNRVHKDGRQYTCNICNRSMISSRSLEWHMAHIHHQSMPGSTNQESEPPEPQRVSCYQCNKTFKTEMILRTHIKNTHIIKDPVKCPDCELMFKSEVRLRHHMMVAHNRLEGTLLCPHCPKRFVNQLRLKTHMISHSEERPYTCEICGFNLKTKIQLIKHHQNRHSDERPLQCRYCAWRCKQVSALVCHERTHTNERPYSCSVCRQRFKYLGDKNKHERRHESLGGSGFKRIVPVKTVKMKEQRTDDSSVSEQDQGSQESMLVGPPQNAQQLYKEEQTEQEFDRGEEEQGSKSSDQIVEFETAEVYEQKYEESSRETSEATELIMNMEDSNVYTEEVTADSIQSNNVEIITDEIMTNDILQSATTAAVVHLQEDDTGKIQVIPVMLDLSDANTAEVALPTASIMYNN